MTKAIEVAVVQNGDLQKTVITPIVNKKEEGVEGIIPITFAGLIAMIGVGSGIITGDVMELLMTLPFSGIMAATGGVLMICNKASKLDRTFFPAGENNVTLLLDMFRSRKKRIFVNTIHVKEKADLDLTAWQNPKNAVPEHEATHTVNQYLRKTKQGFQVEQDISPNHEAIWDMSADALVEVYGVQEKTPAMREITA